MIFISQGDPFAMILYGAALMPLAEHLKRLRVPEALTPWYTDDSAGVGKAQACAQAMDFLRELGPTYGYYPPRAREKLFHLHGGE